MIFVDVQTLIQRYLEIVINCYKLLQIVLIILIGKTNSNFCKNLFEMWLLPFVDILLSWFATGLKTLKEMCANMV